MRGSFWPILLKKSVLVSMAKKYASEFEILNRRRDIRTKISRSSLLKRRFHRSVFWQFEKTDFFNRIGRLLPLTKGSSRPIAAGQQGQNSAKTVAGNEIMRK